MPEYKILKEQIFSSDNYKIVPIRYEDRMLIMKWRNEQIYHLRQSKPLTESDQENYFSNVVSKLFAQESPQQVLFSYLENDECIGYGGLVHINWIDKNAEISFVINSTLEKSNFHKHWGIYLDLIEQVAFHELKLHKIYTYAFDLRPHLYEAIEAKGYLKEAELKEHCSFHEEFKSVIIHSKIVSSLLLRGATTEDCLLFFEWANDGDVRKNSFSPEKIEWKNHVTWFDSKLNNDQSKLYVLMNNNIPLGQVRLDKEGEFWIVDYSIDKKYRGKGLGKEIIKLISKTGIRPIKAVVKTNNESSLRAFKINSFSRQEEQYKGEKVYAFYKQ
jgi:RimJ/RimL family protein N-acetyltransferase